nr:GAF domain-containing protein [Burkholderiaceae bacterium]
MSTHPGDVAALARAGKQAQAIEAASAALAVPKLGAAQRLALLEQRAEAFVAEGRFDDAARDAEAMLGLAGSTPASRIRSLRCQALALMRLGRNKQALAAAEQALALAEKGRDGAALALSVLCLAEAQLRTATHDAALASAQRAAGLFETLADVQGSGRAHWLIAFAQTRLSRNEASRTAALHAAALARQAGDLLGLANALNVLSFSCTDIAERLQVLRRAAEAFERAGYLFGRMVVLGNLSLTFGELGLWRHACRLGAQCMAVAERMGARLNVALEMGAVLKWQVDLGDLPGARAGWPAYDALVDSLNEPVTRSDRELFTAELDAAEGDTAGALKRLRAFLRQVRAHNPGFELYVQIPLARVLLQRGDAAAAQRATQRGIGLLRERGFARTGFGQSQDIWWWHSRALLALGQEDEAWAALQQAHGLMLVAVRNLHDEGLRRSYLNKLQVNRALVPAWLAEAARRGVPDEQRLEHLRLPSSLADPFKRLVDSGLRLNQLRSEAALHDFLIDEVTELSGAERVLLVLEGAGSRRIAGALLPGSEDKAALLQAVTPWLDEAAATREPRLRHGPEGAAPENQRSCLVAPLVAQGELLGHVYADIEGAFGRFGDADRDLLAMLAGQAAVALANLRFAGGLEAQVAERTAEARSAQAEAEQRAAELALINGIQQGIAAQLEFQGVIDLVGDHLHEVFKHVDARVQIGLIDEAQGVLRHLFVRAADGQRRPSQSMPFRRDHPVQQALDRRETLNLRSLQEALDWGYGVRDPGSHTGLSVLLVGIWGSGARLGSATLIAYRDHAFSDSLIGLLETIVASMGVALDNARLFKQTQEALEQQRRAQIEAEQRAAELVIINSIQQGMAAELDFQAIVDLVGDRLREVLHTDTLGIRWYDDETKRVSFLYEVERGQRIYPAPRAIVPGGPVEQLSRTRRPMLYPTRDAMRAAGLLRVGAEECRSALRVPVLRGERMVGFIVLENYEREQAYGEPELRLVSTIAASMGVALDNARLFKETQEALQRQTATAEVLQVISSSVSDAQPVLDKILESCHQLIGAPTQAVMLIGEDGRLHRAARLAVGVEGQPGWSQAELDAANRQADALFPIALEGTGTAHAIASGQVQNYPDVVHGAGVPEGVRAPARHLGRNYSQMIAPLVQGGRSIGSILAQRPALGGFTPKEQALLKTFADQAVIAIQNAKMFRETNEALERQTASAEVLQVISASVADTAPVFDKILDSCQRVIACTDL